MITVTSVFDVTGQLVIDMRAREWCKLPYGRYKTKTGLIRYTHPNGCPNYNKPSHPECPPYATLVGDFFDLTKQHCFAITTFDRGEHVKRMQKAHPEWSEKMCRNVYYWQNSVRSILKKACLSFIRRRDGNMVFRMIPEAMGINVIKTAKNIGISIKSRPDDIVYKIALIGYPKSTGRNITKLFRKRRPCVRVN